MGFQNFFKSSENADLQHMTLELKLDLCRIAIKIVKNYDISHGNKCMIPVRKNIFQFWFEEGTSDISSSVFIIRIMF